MPACEKCNQKYSKIEGELIRKLGLGLNPEDPNFKKIANNAVKAIDVSCGRNEKDENVRSSIKRNFIKESYDLVSNIDYNEYSTAVVPGFGANGSGVPILLSENSLKQFAKKLVYGLTYVFNQTYIETNNSIEIFLWQKMPEEFYYCLKNQGKQFSLGGNFKAKYIIDPLSRGSFWDINIWDRIKISAIVSCDENE